MAHRRNFDDALVDVISDAIRALDDDCLVHEVMCRGVARVLNATVAAWIVLDSEARKCTVVCWPAAREEVALRYVTSETWPSVSPQSARPSVWIWRHSLAFGIMRDLNEAVDYLEMPLAADPAEACLAVFARCEKFSLDDVRFLHLCARPFAAIESYLSALKGRRPDGSTAAPNLDGGVGLLVLPREGGLTKRELEVLALLKQGLKARTIAARLGVSPRTVNKHLGNAYLKLDAHDRLVAVEKAQQLGILPRG
jgi:DNA-binding CsgD family transcriptional regulator